MVGGGRGTSGASVVPSIDSSERGLGQGEGERVERVAVAVEGTGEGRADGFSDRNPEESHIGPRGEGGKKQGHHP